MFEAIAAQGRGQTGKAVAGLVTAADGSKYQLDAVEATHFQVSASAVACGRKMRMGTSDGWDLGSCTVNAWEVTCVACASRTGWTGTADCAECSTGYAGDNGICRACERENYLEREAGI